MSEEDYSLPLENNPIVEEPADPGTSTYNELTFEEKIPTLTGNWILYLNGEMASALVFAQNGKIVEFDEYNTEGGVVKMPFFDSREVNTDLTQHPNSWLCFGGLTDERTDGKETKKNRLICVRIIPPYTNK